MSRHTLVVAIIIFLFVSTVVINETQTVATYYNTLQSTTINNDTLVNSTSISSFTNWVDKEHERRRIEIAKSKDAFLPDWMLGYMDFHDEQRSRLANTTSSTTNATDDIKYLVVRCLEREVE